MSWYELMIVRFRIVLAIETLQLAANICMYFSIQWFDFLEQISGFLLEILVLEVIDPVLAQIRVLVLPRCLVLNLDCFGVDRAHLSTRLVVPAGPGPQQLVVVA